MEAHYLRIPFGVGHTTSYAAICWFAGLVPTRERIWLAALRFLYRIGTTENEFEDMALDAQYGLWACQSLEGTREVSTRNKPLVWFAGLWDMLTTIGWGTREGRVKFFSGQRDRVVHVLCHSAATLEYGYL